MPYPLFHPHNTEPHPMVMTTTDFRRAFPAEGEYIEFKTGLSVDQIRRSAVAFSNTDGGVILLGVDDDASVRGFTLTSKGSAKLNNDVFGNVVNPGRYAVMRIVVGEKPIVVISVARRVEGVSQLTDGSILGRFGASNRALLGEELTRLVARRSLNSFEDTPIGVSVIQADPDLLDELAQGWGWSEDNREARMDEHGFVTANESECQLTVAGALHLLPDPQAVLGKAFVEIFRYRSGAAKHDRRVEVKGPLGHQIQSATSTVLDEVGIDFVVLGTQRHDLPRLPEVVLREAIANAVAHRSYEARGTPVRIDIHDDRVVVTSPGGLPEPVTVANIREQYAARNQVVISTLRRFGLAEDAGRGVDVMQDEMANHLLDPPEFVDTGDSVSVTLRTAGTVALHERAWIAELEERGSIDSDDRLILVHASRGLELTNSVARDLLGVDSVQARHALQRLRDTGLLIQHGERGGAVYIISPEIGAPAGLRLSDDEIDTLVLDLAREQSITNTTVRERLNVDRLQALHILNRLCQSGRLLRHGERRGTRYGLPEANDKQL